MLIFIADNFLCCNSAISLKFRPAAKRSRRISWSAFVQLGDQAGQVMVMFILNHLCQGIRILSGNLLTLAQRLRFPTPVKVC